MKGLASLCLVLAVVSAGAEARARPGETRCWIDRGALVAPAAFGGIAGDFIIDLAAPRSQLHDTAALASGVTADSVRADLRLAGRERRGFAMSVADLDARAGDFPTNIAGILGADALAPYVVEIDFAPCRLGLRRRRAARSGGIGLPLTPVDGVPAAPAAVSDGVTGRQGLFALGTGAAVTLLGEARLARTPRPGAVVVGRLRALSIGGFLVERPAAEPGPTPPGLNGEIGTAVLSRFRMEVDLPAGRLTLWPAYRP